MAALGGQPLIPTLDQEIQRGLGTAGEGWNQDWNPQPNLSTLWLEDLGSPHPCCLPLSSLLFQREWETLVQKVLPSGQVVSPSLSREAGCARVPAGELDQWRYSGTDDALLKEHGPQVPAEVAARPGGGGAQHLPQLEEAQHQSAQPTAEGLQQPAHQGRAHGGAFQGPVPDWAHGVGTGTLGTFCG